MQPNGLKYYVMSLSGYMKPRNRQVWNDELMFSRDAAYEIIHDHETTITKFRDLVSKFQEQNSDLRHQLEKEAKDPASGAESAALHAAEIIDFKKVSVPG